MYKHNHTNYSISCNNQAIIAPFINSAYFYHLCIEIASRTNVVGLKFFDYAQFFLDKPVEIGYNGFIKNGIGN